MPALPAIERACYWLARRSPRDPLPLAGRRDADVAIVGVGWVLRVLERMGLGFSS